MNYSAWNTLISSISGALPTHWYNGATTGASSIVDLGSGATNLTVALASAGLVASTIPSGNPVSGLPYGANVGAIAWASSLAGGYATGASGATNTFEMLCTFTVPASPAATIQNICQANGYEFQLTSSNASTGGNYLSFTIIGNSQQTLGSPCSPGSHILQVSRNAGVNTFLLDGVALGGFGNTTPNTDVNSIALAMDHAYTRWPYLGTSGDFVIWNGLNFTGAQKTLLWQTFTGAASLNLATAPLMGIACQATGTTEPGTIEIYSAVSPWQKIASIAGGNGCNYGAMAPDGVHFWVPIQTDAAIKSFNLRTGNIDATVSGFTGGNTEGPIQIVFHPTLPLAYVASYLNDILWVVNTASLTIIETLTLPWNVDTISISPNGQYVYLNNQSALSNSGFVRVLSTSPYTMTQFNGGASRSEAAWLLPTLDENYLIGVYYALNVIDIFNASNLTLNTSFTLPSTYSTNFQALQTADGTKLYISGGDSGAGYVLSLNMESMPTLTLNAAIPFPNATYPSGITLSYDSRYLFVADFANNSLPNSGLVIIDTTTDEVVETLTSLTLWGPVNPGVTPNMVPNRLLVNQGMTGGAA